METRVVNYKNYTIATEEGNQRGIFFRNPLQKVDFIVIYGNEADDKVSAYKYMYDIKNPIRRLYEILIGNGNIVKNIAKWADHDNFGGFSANILQFPVYFNREYRKLTAYSCGDDNIQKIESYGYEKEYNICSGACDVERTRFYLKNGKTIKIKKNEYYRFTYEHIVKEVIDTGVIE